MRLNRIYTPHLILFAGIVSLGTARPADAQSHSVNLDLNSLGQLGSFDFLNQNSSTIGFDETGGIAGSGAGVFQSTGDAGLDKRVLAIYSPGTIDSSGTTLSTPTFAIDSTTMTSWTASIVVHGSTVGDVAEGGKRKAHVRIGFLGDLNLPDPTKPQDIWKQNPSFQLDAKIEFENATGKYEKLSIESKASPGSGVEVKGTKVEIQNDGLGVSFDYDNWFRFELTIARYTGVGAGPNSYTFASEIFDLGEDGTDLPLSLGVSEFYDAFNAVPYVNLAPFSTDSTVYFAMQLESEKNETPNGFNYQIDNISFSAVPEPGSVAMLLVGAAFLSRRRRLSVAR